MEVVVLAAGHQGWIGGTDHISTRSLAEMHHLSCAGLGYWTYEAHGDWWTKEYDQRK